MSALSNIINENPQVDLDAVDRINLPGSATLHFKYEKGYMFRGVKFQKGLSQPSKMKTWKEDKRSAYTVGHNGQVIGYWWPFRLCVMRDRAHGALQRGISGRKDIGAVSIYMGDSYDNIDNGDEIEYCGDYGEGSKLMDISMDKGTLIRVLRAANINSIYAPIEGIRYDGLYKIVGREMMAKEEGKPQNYRYKLSRGENQKPFLYTGRDARPLGEEQDELFAKKAWIGK